MKRLAITILLLLGAFKASAGWLDLTNDTQEALDSDSLARSQAGHRQSLILLSYGIDYYPQFFVSFRDHSRAGDSDTNFLNFRFPAYDVPDTALLAGKTNVLHFIYQSGNGVPTSNTAFTVMTKLLQYPTNIMETNVSLGALWMTNDFPVATSVITNYYQAIVVDDPPAYSSDGQFGGATILYNGGANTAADAVGVHHIDSFRNISNAIVTGGTLTGPYPANSNLFVQVNVPYDHPGNAYHGAWVLSSFTNALCDSNTWNCVIDGGAGVVRSTNHLTIGSAVANGGLLTLNNFHTDRMAPVLWVPDGISTNDMRGAFSLMPFLTNTFNENLRVTNLISGSYRITIDGTYTIIKTADQLAAGVNLWLEWANQPWDTQARSVMYLMCDMLDISRTTQSDDAHPGTLVLMERYESDARGTWPTFTGGNTAYTAAMKTDENLLMAQDVLIHNAAQQTDHTITISFVVPLYAPVKNQ